TPDLFLAGGLQEGAQLAAARGVPQLAERLGFNLADALARYVELLTDLFQGVLAAVAEAEPHLDDLLLARAERLHHGFRLLAQIQFNDGLRGRQHSAVFDEVAEMAVLFLADRGFERDGFLGDFKNLAYFTDRQIHARRNLVRRRLPAELLDEGARGPY